MPWASPLSLQAGDGINQCERLLRVVTIGSGQFSRLPPPKTARIELPSTTARDQSISPQRDSQSSNEKWISCQMPASCQSRSLRQHVMPEPQPSSCGSISHGIPLRRTNRIPVRQARSGKRGLPPLGLRGAVRVAAAVESDSTRHLEAEECSWIEHSSIDGNSFPILRLVRRRFC